MNLYLPVSCNDEYADKPRFVCVEVTPALLARAHALLALCEAHDLTGVLTDPPTPVTWQGDRCDLPDGEDGFKLEGREMQVTRHGGVYWQCYEGYGGADFESGWIDITTLHNALLNGRGADFYHDIEKADVEEATA